MAEQNQFRLIHRAEVLKQCCFSNTTLHERIKAGLIPPPVSVGDRAVRWVQHEIDSVLAAMVAGKSKQEIRDLVTDLLNQRKHAA